MRVLLITPDFNPKETKIKSHGPYKNSNMAVLPFLNAKSLVVPLGLATVAALTPNDVEADIWDEAVRGLVNESTHFNAEYDIIGVSGYGAHFNRVKELGRIFRKRNIPVAVGGPGVSAAPEHYRNHFDILFIGEAEYTWPRFIADWKAGSYRPEYRQVAKVHMAHSPQPRWDKVAADMPHYLVGGVQTTRGCPFDCEFCDVIYIYGRQARHKSVDQVLREVRALERFGIPHIFFCDDNFIGNARYAKDLLRKLVPLNRSFRNPLGFATQMSLNVAKDDEMLELLADANFYGLYIGIETPNIESLVETNKPQNFKTDLVNDIKKIHSYGLSIQAGMIVGFDHDDTTIFDRQFEFLQKVGIPHGTLNTLRAPIGTKLWIRLHKEGRIVRLRDLRHVTESEEELSSEYGPLTNIVPKLMTRMELLSGYGSLVKRVRDWRNFEARVKEMISQVRRRPNVKRQRRSWKLMLMFLKFVFFSMDGAARGATLRLLLHTLRRAPFMLDKVSRSIGRQYIEAIRVPPLLEAIDEQIRLETADGVQLERDQTVFFVPDGFRTYYKTVFPDLYSRVYRGLFDKERSHDALVEVIYDFLTRWSIGFQHFEEHHRTFLYEICDRTIVKENGNHDALVIESVDTGEVSDEDEKEILTQRQDAVKLNQIADEVLRAVEREMRSFRTKQPES